MKDKIDGRWVSIFEVVKKIGLCKCQLTRARHWNMLIEGCDYRPIIPVRGDGNNRHKFQYNLDRIIIRKSSIINFYAITQGYKREDFVKLYPGSLSPMEPVKSFVEPKDPNKPKGTFGPHNLNHRRKAPVRTSDKWVNA
jgi:hypothetical protein